MSGTNASSTSFNIGKDTRVVVIGPYGRIDPKHIVNFTAHQTVNKVRTQPLNKPRLQRDLPNGWDGTIEIDRSDSTLDDLAAAIEQAFWTGQAIPMGTIYQYIDELNGSTSTYQFDNVTMNVPNAGSYQAETPVKQTLEWSASRRRKV